MVLAGIAACCWLAGGTAPVWAESWPAPVAVGNTPGAVAESQPDRVSPVAEDQGPAQYADNHWLGDFETHFIVSLPFTALYGYVAVVSLDGLVQGAFPPAFRQADMWMVIGLAIGGSLAIALGSANRVPDQSTYRVGRGQAPWPETARPTTEPTAKLNLIRVNY